MADVQLPPGVVKRVLKARRAALAAADGAASAAAVSRDAQRAIAEGAKVFISYITCAAGDIARERKRQTVSADDVRRALDDADWAELAAALAAGALAAAAARGGRAG